jgi:signal transduction histidine kinase
MAAPGQSRTPTTLGLPPQVPKRRPATSEVALRPPSAAFPQQRSTKAAVDLTKLACAHLSDSMRRSMLTTNGVLLAAEHRLSDAEQAGLASVSHSVQQMLLVTNSLQQCATISQSADWSVVDCEGLLTKLVENLRDLLEDTGARVVWQRLPKTFSIEPVLAFVFNELLVNAVNGRAADPMQIRVEARPEESGWTFLVADNGVGIDRRHWESIFHPFFTVDPRAWRPGLGLAVARLGVEHLGGKIQVDASDATGTAFRFSLPRVEPAV